MTLLSFYGTVGLQIHGTAGPLLGDLFGAYLATATNVSLQTVIPIVEEKVYPVGRRIEKAAAYNGRILFVHDRAGHWMSIRFGKSKVPNKISYDPDFDPLRMSKTVEWALHLALASAGTAMVHCMGLMHSNRARLLVAWKATGKTRSFLHLLASGYPVIGDDWCAVNAKGVALPFLKAAFIYKPDLLAAPRESLVGLPPASRMVVPVYRLLELLGRWGRPIERWVMRISPKTRFPMLLNFSHESVSGTGGFPMAGVFLTSRYYDQTAPPVEVEKADGRDVAKEMVRIYDYEFSQFLDSRIVDYAMGSASPVADHVARISKIYESFIEEQPCFHMSLSITATGSEIAQALLK